MWILGVIVTLGDLMIARHVAPAWVWVWWAWLGLWGLAGLVVLIAALVRVVSSGRGRPAPLAPAPLSAASVDLKAGE